jgi:hypothetical protein
MRLSNTSGPDGCSHLALSSIGRPRRPLVLTDLSQVVMNRYSSQRCHVQYVELFFFCLFSPKVIYTTEPLVCPGT